VGVPRAGTDEVAALSGPFGNSTQQEQAGGIVPADLPTLIRPERG